jgi:hypothetical protein
MEKLIIEITDAATIADVKWRWAHPSHDLEIMVEGMGISTRHMSVRIEDTPTVTRACERHGYPCDCDTIAIEANLS